MNEILQVLIIDDQPDDHKIYLAYLEDDSKHRYRFFHAYTGEEGIALYKRQRIDCVLLDYHLPDVDGLQVLKRLSQEDRVVPVVMMTGEGNELVAVTAMKLGSQDYIPKKVVTPSALRRAVDRAAERADMLHRMEEYRRELERSNHDLEQFANIVAHDLKAPLRAVTQHLALVKGATSGTLDEAAQRSMDFAVDGAARMRNLIDALFTYAKLGFAKPALVPVDLNEVLERVLHDLEPAIQESGAKITADALPLVSGDAVLLAQLLQNLIGNALKYGKGTPQVRVGAVRQGGQWVLSVRDNGIGIARAHHQQIFAIFRRLHKDDEYAGVGLGLAVCERIARQHGGKIWVESELGKGATFFCTLNDAEAAVRQDVAYG